MILRIIKRTQILALVGIAVLTGALLWGTLSINPREDTVKPSSSLPDDSRPLRVAYLAGGCFWCVEADMDALPGVVRTVSGYTGGRRPSPTYEEVSSGTTGHREAVEVTYDSSVVSYSELISYFLSHIDPMDGGGQFVDRGKQYAPAIFVTTAEEDIIARETLDALGATGALGAPIAVEVLPLDRFWPAEEYHQNYHTENPVTYTIYRSRSGRDARVKEICELRENTTLPCAK